MKKIITSLFVIVLMVLGSIIFMFKPATAQTGTTVFFSPDPANLYLNGSNSQVVEMWVGDVVDMNGFDITLTYDPEFAHLDSWTVGTFLDISVGSCFIAPGYPDQPGFFRRACVQLGKPLKSGSGVLLRFTFSGLSHGISDLSFVNPLLALGYPPVEVSPLFTNGTLNVTYNPAIIKPSTVSGSFSVQGRADRGGIPVTLSVGEYVGQGPYTVNTTNVSGNNLAFTNVAMDVYILTTAQPRCLNLTEALGKSFGMTSGNTTLAALALVRGNAAWTDNEINAGDVSVLGTYWGLTPADLKPGDRLDGDVNFDGVVDLRDLAIVAGNFGLTSALVYAGWTP